MSEETLKKENNETGKLKHERNNTTQRNQESPYIKISGSSQKSKESESAKTCKTARQWRIIGLEPQTHSPC